MFFSLSQQKMHSWDVISQSTYEHNWFGGNLQMKTEPQELSYSGGQQPNSPQSMDGGRVDQRSPPTVNTPQNMMYCDSSSLLSQQHIQQRLMQQTHMGFNPLTPPGYPNATIMPPQTTAGNTTPFRSFEKDNNRYGNTNLTPSHTPPMDVTPPKSPKFNGNETPEKDSLKVQLTPPNVTTPVTSSHPPMFDSGDESRSLADSGEMDETDHFKEHEGEDDDEDIRTPKVNSHGKMKTHKCKKCDFVAITKLSFWEHSRTHIKAEKMLECPKCPFVTEYKHHLDYHISNHNGTKRFKCEHCAYICVNKSMLNSHMKSHSDIYQYRCQDCSYASKYCHSLKLHLRKYSHSPAMVLNADGTPNPLPIIDVYGTRRGPKSRPRMGEEDSSKVANGNSKKKMKTEMPPQSYGGHQTPFLPMPQLPQIASSAPPMPPSAVNNLSILPNLTSILQHPSLFMNLHHILAAQQSAQQAAAFPINGSYSSMEETSNDHDEENDLRHHSALDLSQPNTPSSNKNKRKGRAVKLALMKGSSDDDDEDDCEPTSTKVINLSSVFPPQSPSSSTTPNKQYLPQQPVIRRDTTTPPSEKAPEKMYECKFCDISFKHAVLYTIHMGYHGYNEVFQCNMCGEKCGDRVAFFLHIARDAHV